MGTKSQFRGLLQPAIGLWGKPLGAPKKEEKPSEEAMPYDDDDIMDETEIDVDAELANEDVSDDELYAVDNEVDGGDYEDDVEVVAEEDDTPIAATAAEATDESAEDEDEYADEEPDYDQELGDQPAAAKIPAPVDVGDPEVADDYDEETTTVSKPPRRKRRAAMPANESKKKTISDYVRDEIQRRIDEDESLRGRDIVAALADNGITVSPAQVSQLLKKAGVSGTPKRRATATVKRAGGVTAQPRKREQPMMANKAKPSAAAPAAKPAARPTNGVRPAPSETIAMLHAANDFVKVCGSREQAALMLEELSELASVFQE